MEVELLKFKNEVLKRRSTLKNIFLILIVLAAIWSIYIFTTPVLNKEDQIVSSYTHNGMYTYNAPVTLSNPLYVKGNVLEMGMPAYFFSVSPTMDVLFTYDLQPSNSSNVDIRILSAIVATSRNSDEVFWKKSLPLDGNSFVSEEDENVFLHSFTVNVPDVQAQVKSLQNQIGYSQGTEVEVVTTVYYEGLVNGRHVDDKKKFSFPLVISNSYYQMPEELEFTDTQDFHMTRSVEKNASIEELKLPISMFLIFLALFLLTVFVRNMEMIDPQHIEKLEVEQENSKFDDWISMGKVPSNLSFPEVVVDSLEDLVDIAADMDCRVIKDSRKDFYFTIKDGIVYIYSQ